MEQFRYGLTPRIQRRCQNHCSDGAKINIIFVSRKFLATFFVRFRKIAYFCIVFHKRHKSYLLISSLELAPRKKKEQQTYIPNGAYTTSVGFTIGCKGSARPE